MSRWRKTNKAKHMARSCGNHGGCPSCEGSRLHASRTREAAAQEQQDEFLVDRLMSSRVAMLGEHSMLPGLSVRERLGWRLLSEEERVMQLESNLDDIMGGE